MKRISVCIGVLALVCLPATAQTTGTPGINDLAINGNGSGGTSCIGTTIGNTLTFSINGVASSPVIGAAAAQCGGFLSVGANTGTLDLDLASLVIFLDGTGPGVIAVFATTDTTGTFNLSVAGTAPTPGPLGGFQFALLGPNGLELTQAHDVTISAVQCGTHPNSGPNVDDGFVQATLVNPFTFYGTSQTSIFMNDNGNLTFGTGDTDFSATEAEMLANQPRIAPCWGDFDSGSGGNLTFGESSGVFSATWANVPMFASNDQNTFCASLDSATGVITLTYQQVPLTIGLTTDPNQVVGISPGQGISGPNNIDFSMALPFMAANATDAIYEDTALTPGFDLQFSTLTFVPLGGTGIGPYTAQ